MAYTLTPISLHLNTDITHKCHIHLTRDQNLVGVIEFFKSDYTLKWEDLEYIRRRTEEFSIMPLPECITGMVIDIRQLIPFISPEVPIIPWKLIDEECPIRLIVPTDRMDFYAGFFEPTWLTSDLNTAISEIRAVLDTLVH